MWPRFERRKWPRGNGYIRPTKAALKADVLVVLIFLFFPLLPFFPLASHDATSARQVPRRPLLWTSNRDDDAKQWMWWKRLGPDSACLAARWLLAFFIFLSPPLRKKTPGLTEVGGRFRCRDGQDLPVNLTCNDRGFTRRCLSSQSSISCWA